MSEHCSPITAATSLQQYRTGVANGWFGRWFQKVKWRWQRNKMIATLTEFDNSLLADIGITRGEITHAVDGLLQEGRNARRNKIKSAELAQSEVRPKMAA